VADLRESPALTIIELLQERGATVRYHDPYVAQVTLSDGEVIDGLGALSDEDLAAADCVLVHTPHSVYEWPQIARRSRLIFDTRGVVHECEAGEGAILYRL